MIIAFTGRKGSGKTTASEYLIDNLGYVRVSFKDGLVKEMKDNFPRTLANISEIYGYKNIDDLFFFKPAIQRSFMQEYGTDVRRNDDADYWVKQWESNIVGMKDVVVDDCRFLNEAEAIRRSGGIIIRLNGGVTTDTHVSEIEMDSIVPDHVLETYPGEVERFYADLSDLLKK